VLTKWQKKVLTYNERIEYWLQTTVDGQWLLVSVDAQHMLNSSQTRLQCIHHVVQLTHQQTTCMPVEDGRVRCSTWATTGVVWVNHLTDSFIPHPWCTKPHRKATGSHPQLLLLAPRVLSCVPCLLWSICASFDVHCHSHVTWPNQSWCN